MNICQRLHTSFNRFLQPFGRVGLRKLDGSDHVRKQILASMLGLTSQDGDLLQISFLRADVSSDLRGSEDLSVGALDGRNGQGNEDQAAIFALPNSLEMVDALPSSDSCQNRSFFILPVFWNHDRDGLADRLSGRVAENSFGAPVPTRDNAIEVLAHDCVVAGVDN